MTAITAPARLAVQRIPRFPWLRVVEHEVLVYRRSWRGTLFSTFLSPVLFLAAMGIGLGAFVDKSNPTALGGIPYLAFLGPGLIAAQAMQTAAFESTYPVMAGIVWLKTFDAMLATPVRVRDVIIGKLLWIGARLAMVTGVFLVVMFLFGAVASPRAILAWPVAILTGLAFTAPIAAFSATQTKDNGFAALFRFGITPLFLFSGTFFPIAQLPELIRPVAYLTPLYHGVQLSSDLALGTGDVVSVAEHLGALLMFIGIGVALCFVTFRRRLVK
jgi:lipooligosaccharide transport system permease protein